MSAISNTSLSLDANLFAMKKGQQAQKQMVEKLIESATKDQQSLSETSRRKIGLGMIIDHRV